MAHHNVWFNLEVFHHRVGVPWGIITFFQMLKIVQFEKISYFQKIDFSGHFRLCLCHFGLRGEFSSLGDSNHMHLLRLLCRPHAWAVCLWATPASGISEISSIRICFEAHTTAEFKHSSTGARTWNPSVDKQAYFPLCHLRCRQSLIESL